MSLIRYVAASLLFASAPALAEPTAHILVQRSVLAGFRYHEGRSVWAHLRVGDSLKLVRERDNPHDAHAVRVEWYGHVLGYVPQGENGHLARQLDHGTRFAARITELRKARNGRNRVVYEISVALK